MPDFNNMYKTYSYPILINDAKYVTKEDRQAFSSILMSMYSHDVLSNVPTCACGKMEKGWRLGDRCKKCETLVEYPSEGDLDFRTWMRTPAGVNGFIIPIVWVQLTKLLNPTGYNLLHYLVTSGGTTPTNVNQITQKRLKYLESIKFPRGWNNFIANFDWFIDILPDLCKINSTKRMKDAVKYAAYLRTVRDRVFPQYMPVPIQAMLVLDQIAHGGGFADKESIAGAIVAAKTIADVERDRVKPLSMAQKEQKMLSITTNLVDYYVTTIKTTFCSKKGWIRGCIWRTKYPWSGRAVIKSLTGPHDDREIHIPWTMGVEIFKWHIFNKLYRRGYTYEQCNLILTRAVNVHSKLVSSILKELISEARFLGPACAFQRNPSLSRLSAQLFYITEVKDNLNDKTISMSALKCVGPNADKFNFISTRVLNTRK